MVTLGTASMALADSHLAEADLTQRYAGGVVQNFVRDFDLPFDAWGAGQKPEDYQASLAKMAALGVSHTTYANIYNPAVVGEGVVSTRPANPSWINLNNAPWMSQVSLPR